MSEQVSIGDQGGEDHAGAGFWIFIACCLALGVLLASIALGVI